MNFLDSYVDTIEGIPLDLGRDLSRLHELGAETNQLVNELNQKYTQLKQSPNDQIINQLDSLLEEVICKSETKLAIATKSFEFVEKETRRLDDDLARFDADFQLSEQEFAELKRQLRAQTNESTEKPASKHPISYQEENSQAKRNGRPARRAADKTLKKLTQSEATTEEPNGQLKAPKDISEPTSYPNEIQQDFVDVPSQPSNSQTTPFLRNPVHSVADSDEQKYCYCNQVSYGEMIACDNEECDIEWFHYDCVGLKMPPKGKWYCEECTQKKKKGLIK